RAVWDAQFGAKKRFHLRYENLRIDRLGEIAVETCGQHAVPIARHRESRDGNHDDVAELRVLSQHTQYAESVETGHLQVTEYEIRIVLLGHLEAGIAVDGVDSGVSAILQQVTDQIQIGLVILDDQDASGHRSLLRHDQRERATPAVLAR